MGNLAFNTKEKGTTDFQPPTDTLARFMYIQNLHLQALTYLGLKENLALKMTKIGLFYCICS